MLIPIHANSDAATDKKLATEITDKKGYAARWSVSLRTCDNWLQRGLPHVKASRKLVRIVVAEADAWVHQQFHTQRRRSAQLHAEQEGGR
jgi:hypothetical protein